MAIIGKENHGHSKKKTFTEHTVVVRLFKDTVSVAEVTTFIHLCLRKVGVRLITTQNSITE